ncbi:hypothetical protein [Burkholderia mayonis]|uniref:hypothetical protein n=1 Tax=Burkholderia mayonis TaxID=1385591 RepID=UPI0009EB02F6|nr:hypothetical protein [Burkholderia mayonis]
MTPVHLKTPLPEGKQVLLTVMDRVARLTNLRYFVVGATARDILMYHLHGFPRARGRTVASIGSVGYAAGDRFRRTSSDRFWGDSGE